VRIQQFQVRQDQLGLLVQLVQLVHKVLQVTQALQVQLVRQALAQMRSQSF
jgi:hypothetical protein